MKYILEMKKINKRFGGIQALQDVDFSCFKGEVHALVGENGAGKSTLLKILAGLYQKDSGAISFNGKAVEFKNPQEAQRAGIAMVYQELTLFPDMTVAENIFLNQEPCNRWGLINQSEIKRRVTELITKYNIDLNPDDLVGYLPIAKQQMVEILKILAREPELIIFDEPTSALAKEEVHKLYEIINALKKNEKTIIFISHRFEEVFAIADRITVFKDGKFVATVLTRETNQDMLIRLMVGRPLKDIFPKKLVQATKKIIFEVKNLNVKGKLSDISFQIREGEVLGIAGLQGHGQTELLKALAGILPKDSGDFFIKSKPVSIRNPIDAIQAGIAFVPEDRKTQGLLLNLTVRENIALKSLYLRQILNFILLDKEREFVNRLIKELSIKAHSCEQQTVNLSGGNQQKVVLAKELGIKPRVILFNEPTRGIDVETKQELYYLMRQLANEGSIVIMVSSDLMEIIGMSDKVLVMYEGKISAELTKENISEENIMRGAVGIA
ncbi:MAG: sugar ABC transporter ATP-binding protein [Clostridia bacterium]|nr:sugar ABC transporter ATP-binding protein [Clostridia bacterium]